MSIDPALLHPSQEMRQQEIAYNVDYQLVMMERRLARAGGQRTDDETAALTARVGQLTAELTSAAAEHALLNAAVKSVTLHLGARLEFRHSQYQIVSDLPSMTATAPCVMAGSLRPGVYFRHYMRCPRICQGVSRH